VPYLGDERLPDMLVSHLGRILHQGSRLYRQHSPLDDTRGILPATLGMNDPSPANGNSIHASGKALHQYSIRSTEYDLGSTDSGAVVPREQFSYWCFDLLFLICSQRGFHVIPAHAVLLTYIPQMPSRPGAAWLP
jgi:hypothetical protein